MLTQADKDLLIKDLCGRLPYGVKCETNRGPLPIYTMAYDGSVLFKDGIIQFCMDNPKPYLRSMRNMTEDEEKEYKSTCTILYGISSFDNGINLETFHTFDWFNKHHFDYRDLIEKGLALEAPEGMY